MTKDHYISIHYGGGSMWECAKGNLLGPYTKEEADRVYDRFEALSSGYDHGLHIVRISPEEVKGSEEEIFLWAQGIAPAP